jgi:putative peptidoglycan lipid II flippase
VSAKPRSVLKFTGLLMIGALLGKALGFVREIQLAKQLGANLVADSLRGAMVAVLMPIAPLQGDLVPSTLVPLYNEWRSEQRSSRMMSSLCLAFVAIAVAFAVLIVLFTDSYVGLLVGGFGTEAQAVTVSFTRIMTLAMPASVLIALFMCVEISLGKSRMTSIRASVQNISIIIGISVMSYTGKVTAIAWAFSISMIITACYGFIVLWREGELSPRDISINASIDAFKVFVHRARPLFLQPLCDQGNTFLEKLLSSVLAVGTLASLDYARTITDTVFYIVSLPIGYLVLGQDQSTAIRDRFILLCRPILHMALPSSAFILIFATDITRLVFQRGAFQAEAISLTSASLQGIAVGLWATTLGWILVRMLNAQQRNRTAAMVFVYAYIGNMITNVVTFRWLGPFGIGLGEAVRGVLILAGTVYALGCSRLLLLLLAQTVPVTVVLGGAGLLVREAFDTPLSRVLVGAALYGAVLIPWFLFYVPETAARIRQRVRRKSELEALTP